MMTMYETSQGKLFTDIHGTGYPILFFHGGPGMSHTYIKPFFEPLSQQHRLIFFDQLGCGKSEIVTDVTEENTVSSAVELINSLDLKDEQYDVVAHSWGAYVVAAALHSGLLKSKPAKIIFLNPTPFKRSLYNEVGRKLLERIPDNILERIGDLSSLKTDVAGAELMRLALSYYSGKENDLPHLDLDYRINTYNSVAASLAEFDFTQTINAIKSRCHFVFGKNDYISPDDFSDLFSLDDKNIYDCIEGGHFAFAEDTERTLKIIGNSLSH